MTRRRALVLAALVAVLVVVAVVLYGSKYCGACQRRKIALRRNFATWLAQQADAIAE